MTEGLNYGQALEAAKNGHRIQRAGWNGKRMWVAMTPGSSIALGQARVGAAAHLANEIRASWASYEGGPGPEDRPITICPHLDMKAADGSLVIGWLASQTDMLAQDWAVL